MIKKLNWNCESRNKKVVKKMKLAQGKPIKHGQTHIKQISHKPIEEKNHGRKRGKNHLEFVPVKNSVRGKKNWKS